MVDQPTNKDAYRGLRHYSPDSVRLIRGALDMGSTPDELRRAIRKQPGPTPMIQMTPDALDYMAANPEVGKVRFVEGERYDFIGE